VEVCGRSEVWVGSNCGGVQEIGIPSLVFLPPSVFFRRSRADL
jgi:hypothetical protein